jgi:hypothetical protein
MAGENLFAFNGDSLLSSTNFRASKPREVRNYIRPCVYFNYFTTGSRPTKGQIDPLHDRILDAKLGNYKFAQSNLGLYVPLYTHTKFAGNDSTEVKTFHLLMTMNGVSDMPTFSALTKQHKLYKLGLGMRMIYGFGSKFVLFFDASPYIVGDKFDAQQTQQLRFASSIVFNFMVDPALSFRVGATRTFLFGNKYYLPMLGVRIGKLDGKCYFSAQFPRYISVNFQPGPKFSWSLYSKAYGGLYNISNGDSIYLGRDSVIQFGQRGLANGVRFDFRTGPNFSFYVSSGLAVNNTISFFSYSFNQQQQQQHPLRPLGPFYRGRPDPTLFINVGLTWRFGKSKKSAGNYLMYDIFSLNNDMDPGDNNAGPGNADITPQQKKDAMNKVQYKDVVDLIDDTDLY